MASRSNGTLDPLDLALEAQAEELILVGAADLDDDELEEAGGEIVEPPEDHPQCVSPEAPAPVEGVTEP
jgi:hypothetical protein